MVPRIPLYGILGAYIGDLSGKAASLVNEQNPMNKNLPSDLPHRYQITLEGRLDERWTDWFGGFSVHVGDNDALHPPITTLTGLLPDQAALRGLLARVWDLNLVLISVIRLEEVV